MNNVHASDVGCWQNQEVIGDEMTKDNINEEKARVWFDLFSFDGSDTI